MHQLIDRRANGRGKSAVNRERFLRRYKSQIRDAVKKMVGERKLSDIEQGGEVRIARKDISEPSFGFGRGGDREFVLPGNREYAAGDRIPRPDGARQGAGGESGGTGESEDAFVFSLSREEFMQIFFDDLELPNLERTVLSQTRLWKSVRAGYTRYGAPSNLAVIRTLSQSLARRIALSGGLGREIAEAEAAFALAVAAGGAAHASALHDEIARLRRRRGALPFLDDHDLRYRHRVQRPEPVARAAMFCLMDVSASMDEDKKDLAKRFFTLLYLFLTRKYDRGGAGVRPPYRRRRGGGRGHVLPRPPLRRHGRALRARARADHPRGALRERLECLHRAGLGRRRVRRRSRAQRALPARVPAPGVALLSPISSSRPPTLPSRRRRCGSSTSRWPSRRAISR